MATDRNNLGGSWYSLGEYQKGIEYFELALSSNLKTLGEDHSRVAIDRNNLGSAWKALGETQKAIGYFEQALVTFEMKLGKDHPNTKTVRKTLAYAKEKKAFTRLISPFFTL